MWWIESSVNRLCGLKWINTSRTFREKKMVNFHSLISISEQYQITDTKEWVSAFLKIRNLIDSLKRRSRSWKSYISPLMRQKMKQNRVNRMFKWTYKFFLQQGIKRRRPFRLYCFIHLYSSKKKKEEEKMSNPEYWTVERKRSKANGKSKHVNIKEKTFIS